MSTQSTETNSEPIRINIRGYKSKLSESQLAEIVKYTCKELISYYKVSDFEALALVMRYYFFEPEDFDQFTHVSLCHMCYQYDERMS